MRSTRLNPAISRSSRCRLVSRNSVTRTRRSIDIPARSNTSSSCPRVRSAKDWATRRGRPTTASRQVSRHACSRLAAGRLLNRGRRQSSHPLVEIARAKRKADALAGLERWRTRHPDAAAHLQPADVLVDAMRGRFQTWTRIRVNLQHVPEALRPPQEPSIRTISQMTGDGQPPRRTRRKPSRARKAS